MQPLVAAAANVYTDPGREGTGHIINLDIQNTTFPVPKDEYESKHNTRNMHLEPCRHLKLLIALLCKKLCSTILLHYRSRQTNYTRRFIHIRLLR